MILNILNPRGRDPQQSFATGAGEPGSGGHPPVNFHAYAACTRGSFHIDTGQCIAENRPVLVLIRHRLRHTLKVINEIRTAGLPCFVSWKETGLQQVAAQLDSASRLALFRDIVRHADAVLTPSDELVPLYDWAAPTIIHFVPTPYPLEQDSWDFSRPLAERAGIFIGTRSFSHLYRNHLHALAMAAALSRRNNCRLTIVNSEGRSGLAMIRALEVPAERLNVVERMPYPQYLRSMAEHRLVLQWDSGSVPGQVAGDALLCRMPCVGGNGVVDRLAFPHLCGGTREGEELGFLADRLLHDDEFWEQSVQQSQQLGRERLTYRVVARRLNELAPQ